MNNQTSLFEEQDYNFDNILNNSRCNADLFSSQLNSQDSLNQQHHLDNSYPEGFFDNIDQISYQHHQHDAQNDLADNANYTQGQQSEQVAQETQSTNNVQHRIPIKEKVQIRKQKLFEQKLRNGQIVQQQQQISQQMEDIISQNQESASTDIDKMLDENLEKESSSLQEKSKKKGKRISKNQEKEQNQLSNNIDDISLLDKKTQQKIKNRISAQRSRDDRKKHLLNLKDEVNSLSERVKTLKEENEQLRQQLESNVCSKCQSQCSTDDSQSECFDYIQQSPYGFDRIERVNSQQFHIFGMNATSSFAIIFCFCLIGIQIHNSNIVQNQISNPMVFLSTNNNLTPQGLSEQTCAQQNSIIQEQNALSVYTGIDQKYVQKDSIINSQLIKGFGRPGSSIESMNLNQNKQNDEIVCPNSYIILYGQDQNEQHNIINLTLTNQTNFYSAYDGQYYPLYQDDQGGQIKLTCLILKYEQISGTQQEL